MNIHDISRRDWIIGGSGLVTATLAGFTGYFAANEPRYYISFAWGHDFDNITAYGQSLNDVLGSMSNSLAIVKRDDGRFGVILDTGFDEQTAFRVSKGQEDFLLDNDMLRVVDIIREGGFNVVDVVPDTLISRIEDIPLKNTQVVEPHTAQLSPLEQEIMNNVNDRIANDERASFLAYDMTTNHEIVSVNSDIPLQCASMVKPFVALAFFHRVENERGFTYGSKSRGYIKKMLNNSSNVSTNWVIDQVGGVGRVQRILNENYPQIFKQTSIVERIPSGGRTYRNKASASDYCRFLQALWHDQLPRSDEIKRFMKLERKDKSYLTHNLPVYVVAYHKTGGTAHLCGDMGIIIAENRAKKDYPYVFVGIIEKESRSGQGWINNRKEIIMDVSRTVYMEMRKKHNLT